MMKSIILVAAAVFLLLFAGCATDGPGGSSKFSQAPTDVLHSGDVVSVSFSGNSQAPPPHNERIKEDGMITPPLLKPVKAAGKTPSQLGQELYHLYVPKYYNRLTVSVLTDSRFFFVAGQVVKPDRYTYVGNLTLLKAITAAGDFTDFANRRKVQVTRANGQRLTINCNKAQKDPSLDVPIFPGDKIFVPRRILY